MKSKLDYIIAVLDLHLTSGKSPEEAWKAAIDDYAYVYHPKKGDTSTQFSRSAERALAAFDDIVENKNDNPN